MLQKDQVAGEQDAGCLVQHRQVAVGMGGGTPGLQPQPPSAKVQRHSSATSSVGGMIRTCSIAAGPKRVAKRVQIKRAALLHFRRQVVMPDEGCVRSEMLHCRKHDPDVRAC